MSTNSYTRRDFLKTLGGGALGYGAIALGITSSCSKKPDYKSTREFVEDEATGMSYEVVRNQAEPLYGGGSATKVLEIGDTGSEKADENYIFDQIRDVSFDGGAIYVADALEMNIRVFDAYGGAHQGTIGRKGRGPGEFTYIDHIHVDDDGFLYVCERSGLLSVFTPDHDFIDPIHKTKSLAKGMTAIYDIASFDPQEYLLHCSFKTSSSYISYAYDNKNENQFVRLNAGGEWTSFGPNIAYPGFDKNIRDLKRATGKPSGRRDMNLYFSILYSRENMFLDRENGLIYTSTQAFPSRVVVRSSDDGRVLKVIEKEISENEPLFVTRKVDIRESWRGPMIPLHVVGNKADGTGTQFHFREEGMGVYADDANIYNVFNKRSIMDRENIRVQHFMDVFDLEGNYKQRIPMEMEIGSNFGGMDDEGNMVVFKKDPWPVVEKYQLGGIEK